MFLSLGASGSSADIEDDFSATSDSAMAIDEDEESEEKVEGEIGGGVLGGEMEREVGRGGGEGRRRRMRRRGWKRERRWREMGQPSMWSERKGELAVMTSTPCVTVKEEITVSIHSITYSI